MLIPLKPGARISQHQPGATGKLPLRGALDQPRDFVPQEWQAEMDNFFITFIDGNVKTQDCASDGFAYLHAPS